MKRVWAVRHACPPLLNFLAITPHPIPYSTWLQITTSNLRTYWVAFCLLAPEESHKIQAFHRFSRFVLLEHPPSFFFSPSAMDEHSFCVGKRDITNCTYINLHAILGSSLIDYFKDLCADDMEFRTTTTDPSTLPMLPLDSLRMIPENYKIEWELCRHSASQILSATGQQDLVCDRYSG